MTIDKEQLEIYMNDLIMQSARSDAGLAEQLKLDLKLNNLTHELAHWNAVRIDRLIEHFRALKASRGDDAEQIAQRFSPEYPGAQAIGRLVNGHGAH